jgi:hypothetical protein
MKDDGPDPESIDGYRANRGLLMRRWYRSLVMDDGIRAKVPDDVVDYEPGLVDEVAEIERLSGRLAAADRIIEEGMQ